MTPEELEKAAEVDIRYWYILHKDDCPTCHAKLGELHPMANLALHFKGTCKDHEWVIRPLYKT